VKQFYAGPNINGWTYYIDSGIAWLPMYCQGTLIWLRRYWTTWPEDRDGNKIAMYQVYFPWDPRRSRGVETHAP
jgi:hypothetical protein